MVRPIIEYGSCVWSPTYSVYVDSIESVQKQFLLFALRRLNWNCGFRLPPYEARLRLINLPSLKTLRLIANILFVFKILNGTIDSPFLLSLIDINVPTRRTRFYELIKLRNYSTNYLEMQPFRAMCRDFNKYYFLINLNESSKALKVSLLNYFSLHNS